MKIGLLFGSFNPVHNGHLVVANGLARIAKADEVWWVLSPQNPFKQHQDLLRYEHRLMMLRMALRNHPQFRICTIEQQMPLPSYTIDTMDKLSSLYPDFTFYLFGGEDLLERLHEWKSYELLLHRYSFFLYKRRGSQHSGLKLQNVHLTDLSLIDVSSTEIRQKIKDHVPISGLLDPSVEALIRHYGWFC